MNLVTLGIDYGVLNAMNLWVACLQPGADGRTHIVNYVLHEDRPDLAEIKVVSREPATAVARDTGGVIVPWCNYDRMGSLWLWHAWLEGNSLCAVDQTNGPVVRVTLEPAPAHFLAPALSTEAGELDVCFLGADRRELLLVRFLASNGGKAASGAPAWRYALPGPIVAARAALGPPGGGSRRRLVLVEQVKDGLALHLVDFTGGAKPSGVTTARIEGMCVVRGSEPGLRIEENGTTHAALIVAPGPESLDLVIADVVFPGDAGGVPRVATEPARKLEIAPAAAAIAYQARPDRRMRRDWVVVLADGTITSSRSNQPPMQPNGSAVVPVQLVALAQATYILTLLPDGPNLEAVR